MKRNFWLGLTVLIAVLGAALLVYRWATTSEISEHKSITIAQFGDFFLYAPLYVAIDAGFFQRHDLDVSLVSTGGDEKTWAAVVSGDASFGVADPTFVAIAASRGQPGKVIATLVNGVPFWGIALKSDIRPLADAAEISQYTVATFPSPSTAYSLQTKMFLDAGIEPEHRIRQGAFGTLIPMLRAGEADIALELEPNVSQAVKQGAHIVYSMKDVYGEFATTGLTVSPKVISEEGELVQDVVCSLQLALAYLRTNRDRSLSILAKRFPEVTEDVARDALDRVLNENIIPAEVTIKDTAWDRAIDLRVAIGDLQNPGPITSYVDNSFAQKAARNCRLE